MNNLFELEKKAMQSETFWYGLLDYFDVEHRNNLEKTPLEILEEYFNDVIENTQDEEDFEEELNEN